MIEKIRQLWNVLRQNNFFATFQKISIYFSAEVAIQALGLISLPVFTYFLDEAGYGIINIYLSLSIVLTVVLSVNLHGAISRYYYEEQEDFSAFLGTSLIAASVTFFVGAIFIFLFRESFSTWINLPERLMGWLLAFAYVSLLFSVFRQVFIPQKASKLVALTSVANHYTKFAFAVVGFLLVTEYVYMGKIIGEFTGAALVTLFMLYKVYPFVKWHFSWDHLRYILSYSLPLIPFILSGYILNFFDQFFINSRLGHAEAGLYSFAYKMGMLMSGFVVALLNGSNPDYYQWMNRNELNKVNEQVLSLTKLLVLATGFLMLFATDLGSLLAAKASFREALPIVPIIVAGYFFFGLANLYYRGIYFLKKNVFLTIIVLTSGIVNVFLNFYFVPIYGYHAAAYTTLACYFLMFVLAVLVTTYWLRLPPLPFQKIAQHSGWLVLLLLLKYGLVPDGDLRLLPILFKMALFGGLSIALFGDKIKTIYQQLR